jgi:hypothetical protein
MQQVTMVAVSARYLHHLRGIQGHYAIMIHSRTLGRCDQRCRVGR